MLTVILLGALATHHAHQLYVSKVAEIQVCFAGAVQQVLMVVFAPKVVKVVYQSAQQVTLYIAVSLLTDTVMMHPYHT
jgi:hypothetical protein